MADLPSGHRDDAHDLTGGVVEAVEVHEQEVGELTRHLAGPRRSDELLDEEGVALGPLDDGDVFRLGHRGGVQGPHEEAYVVLGKRIDLEPVDAAQPHPLGHLTTQRVAAVEVVGTVGDDERDAGDGAGEQEAEHVAGRLVGPVGVLDHDEDGRLLGEGREEVAERVVDVAAVEGLVARRGLAAADPAARLEPGEGGVLLEDAGGDVGLVGHHAAEDLGEGKVGQGAVGEVEAVTGDHVPVGLDRGVAQRHEQARLADPRVAGDQHRAHGLPLPGGRGAPGHTNAELGAQLLQLGIASDEIGGPQRRHGRHCVVSLRHRGADRAAGHFCLVAVVVRARVQRRTP